MPIYKTLKKTHLIPTLLCLTFFISGITKAEDQVVNLYSARQEALIKPLLEAFTNETNIHVNVISSKADALLKRIQSEGINSPADVLLTTDAGRLWRAKESGIFSPIDSQTLQDNIPNNYRDPDLQWFGLSIRLRPIMQTKNSTLEQPLNYEDLSKPIYQGKICVRSSNNIYNQSLVSALIAQRGETKTEEWATGFVANFARKPQGGDRDQIRAAAAGQCEIIIANTYYLAQMLADSSKPTDQEAANNISVIWPNQDGRGVHANISGAGVLKTAPNKDNAIQLIEYLTSDTAQKIYADVNYEYPIKDNLETNAILNAWGEYQADNIQLEQLGEYNAAAVRLMDRAGWK